MECKIDRGVMHEGEKEGEREKAKNWTETSVIVQTESRLSD